MKNLVSLGLTNNNVSDITALSGLSKLQRLYLGGNMLSDVSALSSLDGLNILQLSGNDDITDYSPLVGLSNLKNAPWPEKEGAVIIGIFTQSAASDTQIKAFQKAFAVAAGIEMTGIVVAEKEQSAAYLDGCITNDLQGVKADAICLFPYQDIDYTEELIRAAVNGVALHVFSSEEPDAIYDEICELYQTNSSGQQ